MIEAPPEGLARHLPKLDDLPACIVDLNALAPARAPVSGSEVTEEHVADSRNAKIIDFPDLPPKGSRSYGGKRALMGPELGTGFDLGQRLFAYYGEGDVFLSLRLR